MGTRDISGDGQVRVPDPSKWETPHDYGEGKHAGELEDDENTEEEEDPAGDDD
ncbi:MAG: hypothetical protein ACRDQ4_22905 [Pseudonocardiaceae bacterium]